MADSRLLQLYERLPIWAQNGVCSAAGLRMRRERYNATFQRALRFLDESQWWSLEQQRAYRDERLRLVIRHAYDSVPYYREIFDERKLKPEDIRSADDLHKLPILDKETIRRRQKDLISTAVERTIPFHTGGTTGKALQLMGDTDTQPWQWAVWWRHRHRFALDIGDPFVVFAGRSVVPQSQMSPPIWRRNLAMRQTYVSVHHMTAQNMQPLVEYLQGRRVTYYSGYPSGLYVLASYMLDNHLRLPHPPRITATGAETLLPHQRAVIEQAFGTTVTDQYGASEQCGNISECERHTYHVDMEFGVVEFLPMEGQEEQTRKIICTGLWNMAMPLIRYDIGDIATISGKACGCGREAPTVDRIDGRVESYILTPDGRQLGRLDFLFKDTASIQEAQLVQETIDEVEIRVVVNDAFSAKDEASLLAHARHYMGEVIDIRIEKVAEIPRERNGKFRQIVSKVFKDRYASAGG